MITLMLHVDPTMINEGFEMIRDPKAVVAVCTQADADEVIAWVAATRGLPVVAWADLDKAFEVKTCPGGEHPQPVLEVKRQFQVAIDTWGGI